MSKIEPRSRGRTLRWRVRRHTYVVRFTKAERILDTQLFAAWTCATVEVRAQATIPQMYVDSSREVLGDIRMQGAQAFEKHPILIAKIASRWGGMVTPLSASAVRVANLDAQALEQLWPQLPVARPSAATRAPVHVEATAGDLLDRLESAQSDAERAEAILRLGGVAVEPDLRSRVVQGLRRYIEDNRDSQDSFVVMAVCAAVRKLVMTAPPSDLGLLPMLLEAGHQAASQPDVELEIAKSLVWRLTHDPALALGRDALRNQLLGIVDDYTKDRLLARPDYAATALDAILALAFFTDGLDRPISLLADLKAKWFRALIARRAAQIASALDTNSSPVARQAKSSLSKLVQLDSGA